VSPPVLHLVVLCAELIATTALCIARFARPNPWTLATAIPAGLITVVLGYGSSAHLCDAGQAIHQWVVPALCVTAITIFVDGRAVRAGSRLALLGLAIGLSMDFASVVHGKQYIGRAYPPPSVPGCVGIRDWFTPLTGFYHRGEFMPPRDPKARAAYESAIAREAADVVVNSERPANSAVRSP
jgi:hypothetical protein